MDWQQQLDYIITKYEGSGWKAALARHLGVTKTAVHYWLKGTREPKEESQAKIDRLYRLYKERE